MAAALSVSPVPQEPHPPVEPSLPGQQSGLASRVRERSGPGWSDGVRPGCVYWWCFPHPRSPAPPGVRALRPPHAAALVDHRWLAAMTSRYKDHALRFHANKSSYYTEPKRHFDLWDVAFGDRGQVHLFAPDKATRALLRGPLSVARQDEEAAFHKLQQAEGGGRKKHKAGTAAPPGGRGGGGGGGGGEAGGSSGPQRLPCYESVDKKAKGSGSGSLGLCPSVRVHAEPLDAAAVCAGGRVLERTLFFLAPHFAGNFFHLINDNLVPLLSDLLSTPGCGSGDAGGELSCDPPAALAQFWSDPKRTAGGANVWWEALFPRVFGKALGAETEVLGLGGGGEGSGGGGGGGGVGGIGSGRGRLLCVRRVSWGLGPRPFYTDFVGMRSQALGALRRLALDAHAVARPKPSASLSPPVKAVAGTDRVPMVLFVKRYKKKAEDNPRGGGLHYNRVLGDPENLKAGIEAAGARFVECCDFGAAGIAKMLEVISTADVVVSLHGAGLINGIFARDGVILVELHGGYGADDGEALAHTARWKQYVVADPRASSLTRVFFPVPIRAVERLMFAVSRAPLFCTQSYSEGWRRAGAGVTSRPGYVGLCASCCARMAWNTATAAVFCFLLHCRTSCVFS